MFYPFVTEKARKAAYDTLGTRWIGQGPQVNKFEKAFEYKFGKPCVAVNSGTAALHLAYILAGIDNRSEVITTPLTCAATNIPLLYTGARIIFADIDPKTLTIDPDSVEKLITPWTKAIVVVHLGGQPADMDRILEIAKKHHLKVIEDCCHALGAKYKGKYVPVGDYGCFSFQAIKHITTCDGGMLVLPKEQVEEAKRLRWFGIDREARLGNIWAYDIFEIGYKYQMTDVEASIGLAHLEDIDSILAERERFAKCYLARLKDKKGIQFLDLPDDIQHAWWLFTILVENREAFIEMLLEHGIESSPVHFRNDQYRTFGGRKLDLPGMASIEDRYVSLPIHNNLTIADIFKICDTITTNKW